MLFAVTAREAMAAADVLEERTWMLRWLVAFLRHFGSVPEEARPYWRILWDGTVDPGCLVAHSFHTGTTYVSGGADTDWEPVSTLCAEDLLPERIVGDCGVIDRWRNSFPELFRGAEQILELEVVAREAPEDPHALGRPDGIRTARLEDREMLEEFERCHYVEAGIEPVELDFHELIRNELVLVVEKDGEVAGCVRSNLSDGRYVHAGGLYVRPEKRGSGLGQRLAAGIAWWAGLREGAGVVLDTYITNAAASRAYRGAGYAKVGDGLEARFPDGAWHGRVRSERHRVT